MMKRAISRTALYRFLSVFSLLFIFPFMYVIYTSLQQPGDYDKIVPLANLTLDNYRYVFSQNILTWYKNSIIVTGFIMLGNVIVDSMAAYVIARIKFPGRNIAFFLIIGMMMIPYQIIIVPLYTMLIDLNMLNTYASLILPFLFQGLLVFLMRQYFQSIPKELEEAAKLDGLTRAQMFFRVIIPVSKTAFSTLLIFCFTGTWNSFIWCATFVNDKNMYVLPVGLNTLKDINFDIPGYTMAGVVLVTVPVIIIFAIFQKQFVQGIVMSGIKG